MGPLSSRKSQIFAFEAIIAVSVFLMAIVFLNASVYSKVTERNEKAEKDSLYETAVYASEVLLRTEGIPPDWDPGNYVQLGLEEENFVVSNEKLDMLMTIGNEELVDNIGLRGYKMFINITSVFNYTAQVNYTKGDFPSNPFILIPVYRIFLMDNGTSKIPVKMTMEVWR
jgi:hypothetical protein